MPAENFTSITGVVAPHTAALPALDLSQPLLREPRALIDKDSIYYSRERYRLISQRLGPFSIQHLVIDTYENEIVGTHKLMSDAMAQRDALDPVAP